MFSRAFCENFKNTFFTEQIWTSGSETLFPAGTVARRFHSQKRPTGAGFVPAQNSSSDLVERSCAIAIITTQVHLVNTEKLRI